MGREAAIEYDETSSRNAIRNLLRDWNVLGRWCLSEDNGTLTKLRLGSRKFVV